MATLNIRTSDHDLSLEMAERIKRSAISRGWTSGRIDRDRGTAGARRRPPGILANAARPRS